MSSHRVITDRASIIALKPESVVLDYGGYVMEKITDEWLIMGDAGSRYADDYVQLPAKVLIESWER